MITRLLIKLVITILFIYEAVLASVAAMVMYFQLIDDDIDGNLAVALSGLVGAAAFIYIKYNSKLKHFLLKRIE